MAAARIDTTRHDELAVIRDGLPTQRRTLFADMVDLGISTGELPAAARDGVLAMLETLTVGLVELSADAERHRLAIAAFRDAIATILASSGADQ
jgi:hypothetical protein